MTLAYIRDVEERFPVDGLPGFLYHFFNGGELYYMTELAQVPEGGVGLVLKGTAPIAERRAQFLSMYRGIENIARELKKVALEELNHK